MTISLYQQNLKYAQNRWGTAVSRVSAASLKTYSEEFQFCVAAGDLILLDGNWYATHKGLLGLARRSRCAGIHVEALQHFCDPSAQRWAFRAVVYKSRTCRGFIAYGDAD